MNIIELNDDVLEIIFLKTNLLDQYRLSQINQRFYNIIHTIWRKNQQHTIIDRGLMASNSDESDLEFINFMIAISSYVQHLQIFELSHEQFCLLYDCIFPTIIIFDLVAKAPMNGDIYQMDCFGDDDILMLHKMLPNLKVLKLRLCDISGKYLSGFETLEKLHLSRCSNLESEYFHDLFRKVNLQKVDFMEDCDELSCDAIMELKNCTTLKHVKIADYDLCIETEIMHDLLRMPNLNKLSIYSKNFVFDILERVARNPIKGIEAFKFNGKLQSLGHFFEKIELMKMLRRLTISGCRDVEQESIRNDMLLRVAKDLSDLNELHLCQCMVESELGLLHIINYCHQLRMLEIKDVVGIYVSFIWKAIDILKTQRWRKEPLEVLISKNVIGDNNMQDARIIDNGRLIKINTKLMTAIKKPSGVLKFKFFCN